mgnify:CR=1 FL=1
MGMLDGILGQFGNLDELAQKLGLPADTVQSLAAELPEKLQAGGNPLEVIAEVAAKHGISIDMIQGLLGGSGGGIMGMLDRDGDGNPLDDLGGIARNLFGR